MKLIFSISLLLFSLGLAFGQSNSPLRVEIPVKSGTSPFSCISLGETGLCLFYPTSNDVGKDSISWSFVMVDRNLKEIWKQLKPMHEEVNFIKGVTRKGILYLLFHDTRKTPEENIMVFMIYPGKQLITLHKSTIPDKVEVVDFEVFNDFALVGYNLRKGKPGMLGFSLMSGEKRNFDFNTEEDALLLDITTDTLYQDIYTVYKVQSSSSRNNLKVNRYNSSSALTQSFSFGNEEEKRIINSAEFTVVAEGRGFVSGTYGPGSRNKRNYDYFNDYYNYSYYNSYYRRNINQDNNRDNTPTSDGFFTATLEHGGQGSMRYFNFIDFSNSQKYINDPEALRIKHKFDKKNSSESENPDSKSYSLDYRLITHPVKRIGSSYLYVAEAYYPEYHTMTQMVYDYYGRVIPSSYSVFDGYRYTNAFIASFDSAGNMEWNNGIEMRNVLTSYLNRKMGQFKDNEDLVLFYNANGKMGYKVINGNTTIDNTAYTPIAPKRPGDQFVGEYLGTAEHWYGSYFLLTGYENLSNNNLPENRRNVFYLSKMAYQ